MSGIRGLHHSEQHEENIAVLGIAMAKKAASLLHVNILLNPVPGSYKSVVLLIAQ